MLIVVVSEALYMFRVMQNWVSDKELIRCKIFAIGIVCL